MKIGDRVYWNDPKDKDRGKWGNIYAIRTNDVGKTIIYVEFDGGGCIPCFAHELQLSFLN